MLTAESGPALQIAQWCQERNCTGALTFCIVSAQGLRRKSHDDLSRRFAALGLANRCSIRLSYGTDWRFFLPGSIWLPFFVRHIFKENWSGDQFRVCAGFRYHSSRTGSNTKIPRHCPNTLFHRSVLPLCNDQNKTDTGSTRLILAAFQTTHTLGSDKRSTDRVLSIVAPSQKRIRDAQCYAHGVRHAEVFAVSRVTLARSRCQ